MTSESPTRIDWQRWLARWDTMQTAYLPYREERFTVMLDTLSALLPERFVALDLASGPGAISQRLLTSLPQARCVALDYDPALLALGQGALGDQAGRLRWVEADLRDPVWISQLGETHVDAVLSTTALHWLDTPTLVRLYSQLAALIRPGGVFLNGDHLRFPSHLPTFQRLADTLKRRHEHTAFKERGAEDWRQWWAALAREPGMAPLVAERQRRFARDSQRHDTPAVPAQPAADQRQESTGDDEVFPLVELHEAALRDAGFREVGLIWQRMSNGVLMAVR